MKKRRLNLFRMINKEWLRKLIIPLLIILIIFVFFFATKIHATQLPATFVDGNALTAAELNQWKAERAGDVLPISANSLNYESNTASLGSGTYRWKTVYSNGIATSGNETIKFDVLSATTAFNSGMFYLYTFAHGKGSAIRGCSGPHHANATSGTFLMAWCDDVNVYVFDYNSIDIGSGLLSVLVYYL